MCFASYKFSKRKKKLIKLNPFFWGAFSSRKIHSTLDFYMYQFYIIIIIVIVIIIIILPFFNHHNSNPKKF